MAIEVQCPGCGARFRAADQFAGKRANCPNCGAAIQIEFTDEQLVAGPAVAAGQPAGQPAAGRPPAVAAGQPGGFARAENTCHIAPFQIDPSQFWYGGSSPAQLSGQFREKIITACRKRGLKVVRHPNEANIQIVGVITKVDEGNQAIRYFLPFLAGAATVQVTVKMVDVQGESRYRHLQSSARVGFFGGSSKTMISGCMNRLAVQIAGEALVHSRRGVSTGEKPALMYVGIAAGLVLVVTFITAIVANRWAHNLPRTADSIKPEEVPVWTLVLAVAELFGLGCAAVALAPSSVINSRALLWLLRISGAKGPWGLRIILGCLALVGLAVMVGCLMVAPG